jgi:hypothetical protein
MRKQTIARVLSDLARVIPIPPPNLVYIIEPGADRDGTVLRYHACEFAGTRRWVIRDFGRQTATERFLGAKLAASQAELNRAAFPNRVRHGPENHDRPEPDPDFGETEQNVPPHDYDVSICDETRAARKRGSMDCGDDRLANAMDRGEEPVMNAGELVLIDIERFLKIHAGAKSRSIGAQQNGADPIIRSGSLEGIDQLPAKVKIERIPFLGPVQDEAENTLVPADFELVISRQFQSPCEVGQRRRSYLARRRATTRCHPHQEIHAGAD